MRLADHLLAKTEAREGFTLGPTEDPDVPIGPPPIIRTRKLSELMSAFGVPYEKRFEVVNFYDGDILVRADYPARSYMTEEASSDPTWPRGRAYKWAYLASLSIDRPVAYVPVMDGQILGPGGCPGTGLSCGWEPNTSCWTYLENEKNYRITSGGAGPFCTAKWATWNDFWNASPEQVWAQSGPLPAAYGGPSGAGSGSSGSGSSSSASTASSGGASALAGGTPPSKPASGGGGGISGWLLYGIIAAAIVGGLGLLYAFGSKSKPSSVPTTAVVPSIAAAFKSTVRSKPVAAPPPPPVAAPQQEVSRASLRRSLQRLNPQSLSRIKLA